MSKVHKKNGSFLVFGKRILNKNVAFLWKYLIPQENCNWLLVFAASWCQRLCDFEIIFNKIVKSFSSYGLTKINKNLLFNKANSPCNFLQISIIESILTMVSAKLSLNIRPTLLSRDQSARVSG